MKINSLKLLQCVSAVALTACGGGVRPAAIGANEAIGEGGACTPAEAAGDHDHFVVGWDDGTRAGLESAMGRGIAVVAYTCAGARILSACKVEGAYTYRKLSPKTETVEMKDQGQVAAQLGGTLQLPSEFKAELSQGRQLNLAYMVVGTWSTDVVDVSAAQLTGRCEGATHFVYEVQAGAFALEAGEQGHAAAGAAMLGVGDAAASQDNSRHARTTDGDASQCAAGGSEPIDGCRAPVRANLLAIKG